MQRYSAFLALSLASVASAQTLPNNDFELWGDRFAYEDLQYWNTGNGLYPDVNALTRVPDAGTGYAAHMENHIIGTDTLFGFMLLGNIVDDLPTGGIQYSSIIDGLKFDYRCDLPGYDSAVVLVGAWQGGALVSYDLFTIGGTQATWANASYALNGGVAVQPDSIIMGFASTNPTVSGNTAAGGWFEVDNVDLTYGGGSPDPVPNRDMELWQDVTSLEPDDWGTLNHYLVAYGDTSVLWSTDAYSGTYSALVRSAVLGADTITGILTNGDVGTGGVTGGDAYSGSATSFNGYYRYDPSGADSGQVQVVFTNMGFPVGGGSDYLPSTSGLWQPFSVAISLPFTPDTVTIAFTSGANAGSMLFVDSVWIAGSSTSVAEDPLSGTVLFPNPAGEALFLTARAGTSWRVIDAVGRTCLVGRTTIEQTRIAIDPLPAGTYVLELSSTWGTMSRMFVKQ